MHVSASRMATAFGVFRGVVSQRFDAWMFDITIQYCNYVSLVIVERIYS